MLALIQVRSSSRRFRNKAFFKISNKSIIEHVLFNVFKSKNVKKIVIATSKDKSDNKLVRFLKKKKMKIYRGSLNNVALRMLKAAKKNKSNFFVRINGDSPLIDYNLINKAILIHKKNKKLDLVTNVFPRTFPSGQSVEVIKTKVLEMYLKFMNSDQKEHVTSYFYQNSSKFKIKNFKMKKNYRFKNVKKMSIDYKSDLRNINKFL